MEKKTEKPSSPAIPLLEILNQAETVNVQEVPAVKTANSMEEILDDFSSQDDSCRTFFVSIRPRALPDIKNVIDIDLDNLDAIEDNKYLLDCADILFNNKEYILARNVYSHVLKRVLKDPRGLKGLGKTYLKLGECSSAKKCFTALKQLKFTDSALLWIAQCHWEEKDFVSAIRLLQEIQHPQLLEKNEYFEQQKLLGNCYSNTQQFPLAYIAYQKALEIDPNSDVLQVNLGTLELQNGNFAVAENYFKTALSLNPNNSKAYSGLGLLARQNKQRPESIDFFTKSLESDPLNSVAIHQLVSLAHQLENPSLAYGHLNRYLEEKSNDIEMLFALATLQYSERKWTRCEKSLLKVLSIRPYWKKATGLLEDLNRSRRNNI